MIPALFTSSSALEASQTMLSVVGNNLANSNTNGYKSQTLLFSNQFSQILEGASQASAGNGGRNPIQIGMGVQVAATDTNQTQGTFQSTGNPLDLAIQNNGYFVLNFGDHAVYTRVGSFAVDSNGNLVDPATGAKVQRVGNVGEGTATSPAFQSTSNADIKIPSGLTIPGIATQNVVFKGNLSASAIGPKSQVLTSGQALTAGGVAANVNTSLDALDQTALSALSPTGYQAGDTITVSGTRLDGTSVRAIYTPTGTPASDTVGSLLAVINQAFLSGTPSTGATATLDAAGHIVLTADQPGEGNATLSLTTSAANPSGTVTRFPPFTQTVAGKAGDTATSVIQVFDSQGTPHNVTFTFVKQSNNNWDVRASMPAADGSITGFGMDNTVSGVSFNADGSIASIAGNSTSEVMVTRMPMTIAGTAATLATPLQSLDQHTPAATPYGASDTISITGTDADGSTITPVSLPAFDGLGNPATVGDLITAINSAYTGATAKLDSSGNIEFTANTPGQTSLSLNIADDSSNTGGSTTAFSNFLETVPGTSGDPNITFQINALNGLGTPQSIKLNFGSPGSFSGVTQTGGATSVTVASQDGFSEGTLQSTTVNSNGIISGQFTNGQTESIAQIALATFANPGGLQNAGNNYMTYTGASGLPNVSAPGSGGAGSIQSGGLEGSNVDIGTEFTQLISAQRGYEVNAKAFSITNQVMQAAVDLLH